MKARKQVFHIKIQREIVERKSYSGSTGDLLLPQSWINKEVLIEVEGEKPLTKKTKITGSACHVYMPKKFVGKIATITVILPEPPV